MKILEQTNKNYNGYSIIDVKIEPPLPVTTEHVLFGIDPGTTKMGLAFLWKNICHVFEIQIVRSDDAVVRILLVHELLDKCFAMFDYAPLMTIEGSSYGNAYRQVELAEVRASAVLWALKYGIKPSIVPPLSIRKGVFGSAKLTAEFGWKELPPDAASALACAYFGQI
jgi:hypothetical protein